MTIDKGPVVDGVDFNFWERLTVTNTVYDGYADVFFRFRGGTKDLILTVEGGTTVFYSFNGNTDHGEIIPSTDRSQLIFRNRPVGKIWFRVASGTGTVTVEAWASV